MAAVGQSERVRNIVLNKYVRPALHSGKTSFAVRARDVLRDAEATAGFPRGRTPLVCNVLMSDKLQREGGIEIDRVEGPPSRQSRTVVVHFKPARSSSSQSSEVAETPEEWAFRLTEKLHGLMKEEIAAHGGAEGYLRWVRSEDGEE